jgi:ATP-dependent Clp protease ATP-binding subunit ClpC
MWSRFTEDARRIVHHATNEARAHGSEYVSTEHFLLGLLREPDSTAYALLAELGCPLDEVERLCREQLVDFKQPTPERLTLTPRGKHVIDLGYQSALDLGNHYIGTEHLLLGLINEPGGIAAKVLRRFGVTPKSTFEKTKEVQDRLSRSS